MINRRVIGLVVASLFSAAPLAAQAFAYPAMQPARIVAREYNFVLADANATTTLAFQWREGLGNPKAMFVLDAGVSDAGATTAIFLGGGGAYQIATSSTDMPFDVLLTGNLGLAFAEGVNFLTIPVGASIGRRFPLDGGFAISPFVHPRIVYVRLGGDASGSDSDLEVDLGANFEFKPRMAIRLALSMGDSDAVGISFAWTPQGLR